MKCLKIADTKNVEKNLKKPKSSKQSCSVVHNLYEEVHKQKWKSAQKNKEVFNKQLKITIKA